LDASGYPADTVSLRSVSSDNFVIQDITREPKIVAEVDFDSAPGKPKVSKALSGHSAVNTGR
jgi:hypothetical protein